MAREYQEKEFDDEVYEDGYYEDNYEEEELEDDPEAVEPGAVAPIKAKKQAPAIDEDEEDDEDEEEEESDDDLDSDASWDKDRRVLVSYACEDCDYRWDDYIIKKNELEDEEEAYDTVCPMCGSMSITQI